MRTAFRVLGLVVALVAGGLAFAGDEDEAVQRKKKLKGKRGGDMTEKMFARMDKNGDGKISKEEFTKFFEEVGKNKGGGKGGAFAGRAFEKLDENNDGWLSKAEFKKLSGLREKLKGKLGKGKAEEEQKEEKKEGKKP